MNNHTPNTSTAQSNLALCPHCQVWRPAHTVKKGWRKHEDGTRETIIRCEECRKKWDREYHRNYGRTYSKKPKVKARMRDYMRDYMREYTKTERGEAKNAVRNAITNGHLIHPNFINCEDCGGQAQHYHHPDYSKPTDVVALCAICHKARHNDDK